RDAEPAAGDMPGLLQLRDDALGRVRRHREADADRAPRGRIDRGVDADHLATQVEGRPAGIAPVDRRVDLDEIVIWPFVDIAAERRDDPGGDGAAEPERIADRDHPVADLSLLAVAPSDERQLVLAVDLDQGEVGLIVAAD